VRAADLDHKELLEMDPEGGVIRFAGQRALLLDAVAMGLLRKYLVENFGLTAARAVLTQFGFAHGWRMAEAMRTEFPWESDDEWRNADHGFGPLLHSADSERDDDLEGHRRRRRLLLERGGQRHLHHLRCTADHRSHSHALAGGWHLCLGADRHHF